MIWNFVLFFFTLFAICEHEYRLNSTITDIKAAYILLGIFFLFGAHTRASAQDVVDGQSSLIERFALKTNAVEWLLTVPNLQVEFDILPSQYNQHTVQLGAKYNWNTGGKYAPYYVFNVFDIRPEYRYHFRLDKEKLLNGKSKGIASILPGSWKACYLGAYAQYGTFSVKPGETGRQGTLFGAGVSAGWETPLYQYSRGVIDLDLGLSIGVIASQWTNYQLNQDNYTYSRVGGEPDRLHVLPMVTELRAVFSWRRRSVRERYLETDPAIEKYKQALKDIEANFLSSTKEEFDKYQDARTMEQYRQNDSLYRADYTASLDETVENCQRNLQIYKLDKKRSDRLEAEIQRRRKDLLSKFDAALQKGKSDANKKKDKDKDEEKNEE